MRIYQDGNALSTYISLGYGSDLRLLFIVNMTLNIQVFVPSRRIVRRSRPSR